MLIRREARPRRAKAVSDSWLMQRGERRCRAATSRGRQKTTRTATLSKQEERGASVDKKRRARDEPELFPTAGSCSEASEMTRSHEPQTARRRRALSRGVNTRWRCPGIAGSDSWLRKGRDAAQPRTAGVT